MKTKIITSALLALALIGSKSFIRADELITNGDFSANASSYTTVYGYDNGAPIEPTGNDNPPAPTGWTPTPTDSNIGVSGSDVGTYSPLGPASSSIDTGGTVADMAFIQDDANNVAGTFPILSQTFSVVAGDTYSLTYVGGMRNFNDTTGDGLLAVVVDGTTPEVGNVLFDETSTLSKSEFESNTDGSSDFTQIYTDAGATVDTFVADQTGDVTLSFSTIDGGGNDVTADVSDISVSTVPTPEPSTYALFLGGAVVLVLVQRLRKLQA